jgi:hypothetical protein
MSLVISPGFYLQTQLLNIFNNVNPKIVFKNETDGEICSVVLENPNKWPPLISVYWGQLQEKIELGGESFIRASPGTYDLYILDCSERLVFEEQNFYLQDDTEIIIKEPQGNLLIQNDSQDSICYISLKMIRERNQQPYYDWSHILEISPQSKKKINIFPGIYTVRISNCDGEILSRSENIIVTGSTITNVIIGQISPLQIEYAKEAETEICFLYVNSMANPSIGDDFLSTNFVLPGESTMLNLPAGDYKILIRDCRGRFLFQESNILITGFNKQEIYVPSPNSVLKIEEPKDLSVCELYISNDIEKSKGTDLYSQIEYGIPLVEGYYDIQVNFCKDSWTLDFGNLDKPIIFKKKYISGEQLLKLTDPRPWIVQFASEDRNRIPWIIGITLCGFCGFSFFIFIFIIFIIFGLWRNRTRRNQ